MLKNDNMNLIEQIRRERLQDLIDEYGSIVALAGKLERQPAQISQWKNASIDSKSGKPRHMKSETARRIEKIVGKPLGWMDQPDTPAHALVLKDNTGVYKVERASQKTDRQKRLDAIQSLLNQIDDTGLAIVLDKCRDLSKQYSMSVKQTA